MAGSRLQLVKIQFPVPYLAIAFKASKDSEGRDSFPIPGFGTITKLTDSQALAAREILSEDPALPMLFELEFPGGVKGLFMRSEQTSLVETSHDNSRSEQPARSRSAR